MSKFVIFLSIFIWSSISFGGCQDDAERIAVATWGGSAYSSSYIGNGNWSVTIIYDNGNFSNVNVNAGCGE